MTTPPMDLDALENRLDRFDGLLVESETVRSLIARVRELEALNEERKKYTFDQEQVLEYAEGEHAHVGRLTAALQQVSLENADAHHDAAAWKKRAEAAEADAAAWKEAVEAAGPTLYQAPWNDQISRPAQHWIKQRHDALIDNEPEPS